ncbi:MAG: ABC transporter ATP-binding protein [Roseomonas sp.]|nr:ABC transporter ATP-binding protein [Roseomonas sp.]MCA3380843.1 ABC transporter ATP-binding protein [Roseomonas sp.]
MKAISPFLSVAGLEKSYGLHKAVNGVSLMVEEGHTLALLGPSGCGKTTMLRCIAGLETPEAGRIEIGGVCVFDAAQRINLQPEARGLGIVFQSYAVWPHMTVAENVGFPLKVRKIGVAERDQRVARILDIVGLGAWHDRPATNLSGGQQQRVALARALIHEPRLVLFDEALSNLDAQLREQMRLELNLLQDRLGFTAIYVTHDQAEAFGLAEHIVVMNKGRIETQGPPRRIFHEPDTAFVARFLGLNLLPGRIKGRDGAQAEITLAGGACIRGHIPQKAGNLTGGDAAIACIRKEHVQLSVTPGSIMARIRGSSFLGLADEFILDLAGQELRAIQHFPEARVDMIVGVDIPSTHCVILPPEDQ